MMPVGRCYMHGGKTPTGMALPQFKTGRYSKYLPVRLTERYQEAAQDGELLAMREDIALLDARLSDLLKRVDSGESGHLWQTLQLTYQDMLAARAEGDRLKMAERLNALGALIERGHSDYGAWREISTLLEQRRKLVESERKRLIDLQQMLTTNEAMTMLAVIIDTVKRNVTDRSALAAISADVARLLAGQVRSSPQ